MKKELEMKLAEQFPFMAPQNTYEAQEKEGCIYDLYGAFGCEFDDGWYELMCDMCTEITELYEKAGKPVDIVVDQAKEKYGTLRFYYHIEGKKSGIQAIDFLGQGSLRMSPEGEEIHRQVADIVQKYEDKSETVCECCGEPGKLRTDRAWILTLCDACNEKNSR